MWGTLLPIGEDISIKTKMDFTVYIKFIYQAILWTMVYVMCA